MIKYNNKNMLHTNWVIVSVSISRCFLRGELSTYQILVIKREKRSPGASENSITFVRCGSFRLGSFVSTCSKLGVRPRAYSHPRTKSEHQVFHVRTYMCMYLHIYLQIANRFVGNNTRRCPGGIAACRQTQV